MTTTWGTCLTVQCRPPCFQCWGCQLSSWSRNKGSQMPCRVAKKKKDYYSRSTITFQTSPGPWERFSSVSKDQDEWLHYTGSSEIGGVWSLLIFTVLRWGVLNSWYLRLLTFKSSLYLFIPFSLLSSLFVSCWPDNLLVSSEKLELV